MALVSIYALELDPDFDEGALDVIDESQLGTLQALMPHGPAWPIDLGLNLVEFERALSYEFARVQRRVTDLINEIFPDTIYEMLADQERVWGLPDLCSQPTTISGRRTALQGKMVGFGDPDITNIELAILGLNYVASVQTPIRTANLFTCDSACDSSLYGSQWLFWWRVVTITGANDAELACVLESLTPDHTVRSMNFLAWGDATAAEANSWDSVCWSAALGLFVAVASGGTHRVMTSPDGVTWTPQTAAEANSWPAICWSAALGLFVAVASGGTHRVMTSPDGVTWTPQTAAEANSWDSVCWSAALGLFVAVASGGTHRVMTSPDGVTWTPQTAAEANSWRAICWSPELGLFCAVALSGTHEIMTSPDGVTWTPQTAAEANSWRAICWSPELGLFCAVAAGGTHRVMTSPDGVMWTPQTAAEANSWQTVTATDIGFVALSTDGTHRVMTSPDGVTWFPVTAPGSAQVWLQACWAPEILTLVGVGNVNTNVLLLK